MGLSKHPLHLELSLIKVLTLVLITLHTPFHSYCLCQYKNTFKKHYHHSVVELATQPFVILDFLPKEIWKYFLLLLLLLNYFNLFFPTIQIKAKEKNGILRVWSLFNFLLFSLKFMPLCFDARVTRLNASPAYFENHMWLPITVHTSKTGHTKWQKVVQEDLPIDPTREWMDWVHVYCLSHIPKLHHDSRYHGVCAICHVYPFKGNVFLSHRNFLSQHKQSNLEDLR